eukprot:TRINITY_DN42538_c0_g1_i6.p1 TRINITY_DN42538_c0_g1~~TRINITY_DN42538_c0_g1_i6.p1  ORF type:complete len:391 (-),score=117.65 TRINITY_DN42538_c0_g1_i6:476-1648(-)
MPWLPQQAASGGGFDQQQIGGDAVKAAGVDAKRLSTGAFEGLERENVLLRRQLRRYIEEDESLHKRNLDLQRQLDASARLLAQQNQAHTSHRTDESARFQKELQLQKQMSDMLASRVTSLQKECVSKTGEVEACQRELAAIQLQLEQMTKELVDLCALLMPSAASDLACGKPGLSGLRDALERCKLVCRAKLETVDIWQQPFQLRSSAALHQVTSTAHTAELPTGRHPATSSSHDYEGVTRSPERRGDPSPGLPPPSVHTNGQHEAAELRPDFFAAEAQARAVEACQAELKISKAQSAQILAELMSCRQLLATRDIEVKELQLLGKYFPGQPRPSIKELDLTAFADDLRRTCEGLSAEVQELRVEREVMKSQLQHYQQRQPGQHFQMPLG